MMSNALSEDLVRTLASLSTEQRLLVMLADVEGMPYKEIADIVGKPIGTIRSRLHRTHKLMRLKLEAIQRERKGKQQRPAAAFSYSMGA